MLPAELTSNAAVRANLWHLSKGLYARVAGSRPSGTTALLEDIAVPVAALSRTCAGLKELFERHHYENAVIFGHAKDGNIHFLINEEFVRGVYFQACVNTMFGPHQRGQDGVAVAVFALCERTRVALVAPEQ